MRKISEALGIPSGLSEQANKVVDTIIKNLSNMNMPPPSNFNGYRGALLGLTEQIVHETTLAKIDIIFSDLNIDVNFNLELILSGTHKGVSPLLLNASYIRNYGDIIFKKEKPVAENDISKSKIVIRVIIDANHYNSITPSDIINAFINPLDKIGLSQMIAHELKHLYDAYKRKDVDLGDRAEYVISKNALDDNDAIRNFYYLLYTMSYTENLVKPVELYQVMIDEKITKTQFLDFMKNSEIVGVVNVAENFTVDEFKKELESDSSFMRFINPSIGMTSLKYIMLMHNKELIDYIEDVLLKQIRKDNISVVLNGRNQNGMINALDASKNDMREYLDKLKSTHKKNPEKFFKDIEKRINFAAKKIKRKLYKLYDLAIDDKSSNSDFFKKN